MEKRFSGVLRFFALILRLADYLVAAALILIFALFCSARVGYFLLLVFLGAPLLSLLLARIFAGKVRITGTFDGTHVAVGEHVTLSLRLFNPLILPSPPVEIQTVHSMQLEDVEETESFYIKPREKKTVPVSYETVLPGGAVCRVQQVLVWDYFHIRSFAVSLPAEELSFLASVLPSIPEISENHPVLEQVMVSAFLAGDSDETSDVGGAESGGMPGYDYREYQPGDPLKRIAGKLSARTGRLMVRLDDPNAVAGVTILLDPVCRREQMTMLSAIWYREMCETALGMILTLLSKNITVKIFYCKRDGWKERSLLSERELGELGEELSEISFDIGIPETYGRVPGEELCRGGETYLYFSAQPDEEARQELSRLAGGDSRLIHIYDVSKGESS